MEMLLLISCSCNKAECVMMFILFLLYHSAACNPAEGLLTQGDDHTEAGERMQRQRLTTSWYKSTLCHII